MSLGWLLPTCFAVVLELLVIYYLARAMRTRFPFVLVFCSVQILVVSTDTVCTLIGVQSHVYAPIYWAGDLIAHGAISLLILSLIWHSIERPSDRQKAVGFLGLAVLCFAL